MCKNTLLIRFEHPFKWLLIVPLPIWHNLYFLITARLAKPVFPATQINVCEYNGSIHSSQERSKKKWKINIELDRKTVSE